MGKQLVTKEVFRLSQAYYDTFTSNAGKEVLKDLENNVNLKLSLCPVFIDGTTYTDPNITTFFNEGKRSIYLMIVGILNRIRNGELEIKEEKPDDRTSDYAESNE